jgi:hypothetical protein
MRGVETGKFLGWYFPEENKVPFFIANLNCCYTSDRAYDVRRHIEGKHAIVNRNNMNYASNTSNTLIDGNVECDGYANRRKKGTYKRKPTKFEKEKILDRGVKENGGDYKEGNDKMVIGEKYSIIKIFQCNFCIFKSKHKWVVRRHLEKKHSETQ